jgi:hypothetical protein
MHFPVRSLALTAPGDLATIDRMTQALGAIATNTNCCAERTAGRGGHKPRCCGR